MVDLAQAYLTTTNSNVAFNHAFKAYKLNKKSVKAGINDEGDRFEIVILCTMAMAQYRLKNYEKSLKLLKKAAKITESLYSEDDQAHFPILFGLGKVHAAMGKLKEALYFLREAWEIKDQFHKDHICLASVYLEMAYIYKQQNDKKNCIHFLELALKTYEANKG
jgi:tetratricopeptide (TPR) repeat protein